MMHSAQTRQEGDALKAWERLCSHYLNFTAMERHRVILAGIPLTDLTSMVKALQPLPSEVVHKALGYRPPVKGARPARLSLQVSDAFISLLEVTDTACSVLGDRDEAIHWLSSPALALDGQVPLALMATRPGVKELKTLLAQMDHGVYI